jgi:hypothetical protein
MTMRTPRGASRRVPVSAATLACAAVLSLAACASATAGAGGLSPDVPLGRARGAVGDVSQRQIQGAVLSQDPSRSLLDILASYWPTTMRGDPRAQQLGGDSGVGVYVNGNYMGGWDFLRTVRAGEVTRVQRLTTAEEYLRYGRSSVNGGVVLTFRGSAGR